MIESVNLNVWFDNGDCSEIELSPIQTMIIVKILGIEPCDDNCIACYTDAALKSFVEMEGNPLKLKALD